MFQNSKPSEIFQEFIEIMGEKIQLNKWTGYRGDMGKEGESYFTYWHDFNIMYHISTLMDSEQHRRLIGNDIAIIIFQESTSVDPLKIDLGQVPQIFGIVQPYLSLNQPTKYRIAFFSRINLPIFPPPLPKNYLFQKYEIKDFLLTKIINGKYMTMQYPPLSRLFYIPRGTSIVF
jgi:hypothetical protein